MKKFFNGKSDVNGTNAARSGDAQAGQNDRSGRVMFAGRGASARFVRANASGVARGDGVAKTPLNKRLMALVLAIVMVLALVPAGVFVLRPKAAVSAALEPVTMSVRINGKASGTTTIDPGKITDNLASAKVSLPDGAEFVKAVVVDNSTYAETQIYAVGNKTTNGNTKTYYSINSDGYTGVAKGSNDELVLVYANKYEVSYDHTTFADGLFTVSDGQATAGTFRSSSYYDPTSQKHYIYGGEDLVIKEISPVQDYKTNKVTYNTTNTSGTERVKNSKSTISSSMITGDLEVDVKFTPVDEYTVQDARYMSGSKYYSDYYHLDNHGGTSLSKTQKGSVNSLGTVDKGETKTFYVFSQLNSTTSEVWRLSMLSINGTDLEFPNETNTPVATTVPGFGAVNVTYEGDLNMDGESKTRAVYKIEVPNVHQNIEVNYYFTNIKKRQIIVKGLEGINKTAAAVENQIGTGLIAGRYYTYASNKLNVYDAFYSADFLDQNIFPSDNLILYTVKPGYNPYQITTSMKFDNVAATGTIRETDVTGSPQDVIKNAGSAWGDEGRFDTRWRYWGKNTNDLKHQEETYLRKKLLLTTISADTTNSWYAVALSQNESKNQQLYLNAKPYEYKIKLYTDGGTLSADGYTSGTDSVGAYHIETSAHKISDARPYGYLPANAPTLAGKYFAGWRMLDSDGSELTNIDYFYSPSAEVDIDEETISHAIGNVQDLNQVIAFKAIYKDLKDADVTTVQVDGRVQNGFDDNGDATYQDFVSQTEQQISKQETALLNDHSGYASSNYYIVNDSSVLVQNQTKGMESDEVPNDNKFYIQYDFNLLDLKVEKKVQGNLRTRLFPVAVTLVRNDAESPVTRAQYQTYLENLGGTKWTIREQEQDEDGNDIIPADTIIIDGTLKKGESFTVPVPYGWTYEVQEGTVKNSEVSYSDPSSGTMTKDTDVLITNKVADSGIQSSKTISGPDANGNYTITMEAYATAQTIADESADPIPMDIALVIDQSGSMATKDMKPRYVSTGNQNWTVDAATNSGTTYYYKPNADEEKYYPVQAKEGTIYEAVKDAPTVSALKGWGHDGASLLANGSPVYYNVPTSYYAIDSNQRIHKVYLVTVGQNLTYSAYPYFYTNNDYTSKRIYTAHNTSSYTTGLVNEEHPYNNGNEWDDSVYWSVLYGAWGSGHFYKTSSNAIVNALGSDYTRKITVGVFREGSIKMMSMASNGQICYICQTGTNQGKAIGATKTDFDNAKRNYSWISNGDRVYGLYSPKDGTNYNALYYVDDNHNEVSIGNSVDVADATAYSGELFTVEGTVTRVQALQSAVTQFVDAVAENAKETGADHKIGIIGFAGNKFPGNSNGRTAYDTTPYDYTNSGLFLNDSFKNYRTINGFESATNNPYINLHYYTSTSVDNNGIPTTAPVYYSGGNWYRIGTGEKYTGSTFYEPKYAELEPADYHNALVDASLSDNGSYTGEANTKLTNAIANFGYYGGTYTSYGMHMANQLFKSENNDSTYIDSEGNTRYRNRVIVVFTDGEPGANGYSSSIAGEALVDGNIAKQTISDGGYNATVYTIGLFPGNASVDVQNFMNQLSSNYTVPTSNVYGAPSGQANANAVSADGSTNLDASKTYYYKNPDDGGKTTAVTTMHEGQSTLGWWVKTETGYQQWSPKYENTGSIFTGEDDREGTIWFYDSNGNRVSEEKVQTNQIYFTSSSTRSTSTALKYEYRWYDSNNKIRDPIKQRYGTYDTDRNTYQFFSLGTPKEESDQYYYDAKNQAALEQAFNDAFETMTTVRTTLGPENAYLQDTITKYFDCSDATVTAQTQSGIHAEGAATPTWTSSPADPEATDGNVQTTIDKNTGLVTVTGFKYNELFVGEGNVDDNNILIPGKKIIVTVSGLKPFNEFDDEKLAALGFDIKSNTEESGIYEYPTLSKMENGNIVEYYDTEHPKIVEPFTIPEINRPKHNILIEGDDKTATYTVQFLLKDEHGDSVAGNKTFYIQDKDGNISQATFSDGALTWKSFTLENKESIKDSIIFENFDPNDTNNYSIAVKVTKANDDANCSHSIVLETDKDGTLTNTEDEAFGTAYDLKRTKVAETEDELVSTTTHIDSIRTPVSVTLRELTQMNAGSTADYTDPEKEFIIKLKLTKDESGTELGEQMTFSGITFDEHGEATIPMKHEQTRTLELPNGYYLAIDVDEDTQDQYSDTYTRGTNATDGEDVTAGSGDNTHYAAYAIANGQYITIINSMEEPVITGFSDNERSFGVVLGCIAAVSAAAAAGYVVMRRRRART